MNIESMVAASGLTKEQIKDAVLNGHKQAATIRRIECKHKVEALMRSARFVQTYGIKTNMARSYPISAEGARLIAQQFEELNAGVFGSAGRTLAQRFRNFMQSVDDMAK